MIARNQRSTSDDDAFFNADLSSIKFASDSVTIAKIRELNRELFDKGGILKMESYQTFCDDELYPLINAERLLALSAYAQAKGTKIPSHMEYDAIYDEAVEFYVKYGLASGPFEAGEIIRDIERQARDLANTKQK